jgi:ribosome-associated protein
MNEQAEPDPKVDERPINLTQMLKLAGCAASGGEAKALIAAGLVQVNGQVELRKRCKLKAGDTIVVRGGSTIVVPAPAAGRPFVASMPP